MDVISVSFGPQIFVSQLRLINSGVKPFIWRTQHNDTQHKDTQHNSK
jgi:hypothetical protein